MSWGIWAIIAIVLAIAETLTVDFTFLMLAGGAFAAAGVAGLTDSLAIQIITFAVVATLLLFFVRPWARKHVNDSSTGESNVYAMVGQAGRTLSAVDRTAGRVKINGEVWSAQTHGETIPSDTPVRVVEVHGANAVVEAL